MRSASFRGRGLSEGPPNALYSTAVRLTGLERVRGGHGALGTVPFFEVIPMPLVAVSAGRAIRALGSSAWLEDLGPDGVPGAVAALADSTLGSAVLSYLDGDSKCVTVELHCNLIGPPPGKAEGIRCEAEVIHSASNSALATAYLRDNNGDLIAHAVQYMLISPADASPGPRGPGDGRDNDLNVVPTSRPHGEDLCPVEALTPPTSAVRVESSNGTGIRLSVPSAQHLANSVGWVHGGATAVVATLASAMAIAGRVPAKSFPRSLTIQYLRPIPASSGFTCETEVVHQGRSLVFLRGAIETSDGRLAAVISETRQVGST